jgi:CrcB protein
MTPPGLAQASVLVFFGGGFGAWARMMTGRLWNALIGPVALAGFPYATLSANVLGSLAMGLLTGWLARHGQGGEAWRLLLGVGILGGYTTFSSFALEFALFVERGQLGLAAAYVGISLAAGFLSLFGGLYVMRSLG